MTAINQRLGRLEAANREFTLPVEVRAALGRVVEGSATDADYEFLTRPAYQSVLDALSEKELSEAIAAMDRRIGQLEAEGREHGEQH